MIELDLRLRKKLGRLYLEKPRTFGEELDARLERKRSMGGRGGKLRQSTVSFYEQCVRPWEPRWDVLIPNLRRSFVEDHIARRAEVAPVAARNELQFAKAALRDAESRGQQVDVGIFAIASIHHEPAEGRALEFDQLDAIAAWMPDRIERIVFLCGLVGLRWREAVFLDDSMLDLEGGQIVIPRDLNKSRREKPVPLAGVELRLLREQRMARPAGTRILFPSLKGGVYTKSGFRSVWLPALLGAGLAHEDVDPKGKPKIVAEFKFHWLRHTAISLMARAGMAPELIAQRVGHTDGGALIYRRYRHLYSSEVQAAVSLIDDLVAASRGPQVVPRVATSTEGRNVQD
jgi:integrase